MTNYYSPLEPDLFYHLYNRGNNRENLFYQDKNYRYFLEKYAKHLSAVVDTYVYCLLPNHFHLLVRIKRPDEVGAAIRLRGAADFPSLQDLESLSTHAIVSECFRRFFMAYAKAINRQEDRVGSLFQKNFKRRPVQSDGHFTNVICYLHTNAQLHGLCGDFREWPHSSYNALCGDGRTQLNRSAVIAWFGSKEDMVDQHKAYTGLKNMETIVIED